MIQFEKVSKRYGPINALNEVSFKIESGRIVGFLGPNGAGKTTTIRLITNYLTPSAGSIRIAGMEWTEQTRRLSAKIGYLPEHTPLYGDMTVLETLLFQGRLYGLTGSALEAATRRVVGLCGLAERLKQTVQTLSKGFRQRVGLARAMIHDPDILILDEPTTGLDPNQIIEIRDMIRTFGRTKTVLLATHILHHIPEICDNVLVLANGGLVFDGTPEEMAALDETRESAVLETPHEFESVRNFLNGFPFVNSVKLVQSQAGYHRYLLRGDLNRDYMVALHSAIADAGWPICGFHGEPPSLERVFEKLTRGARP